MAYRTDLTNSVTNALAVFDALYAARGVTPPSNPTKVAFVDRIIRHHGLDPADYTNAEKASIFLDVIWTDLRAKVRSDAEKQRTADVRATIQAGVSADLAEFDG